MIYDKSDSDASESSKDNQSRALQNLPNLRPENIQASVSNIVKNTPNIV